MQSLIAVLTFPLLLLNALGGIVAFIWLAVLGQWSVLGYGVLYIMLMPWVFALAQLPGMVPAMAGAWLLERNWRLPAIGCMFVSSLWTSALIVLWCATIAYKYMNLAAGDSRIPMLLWGYTVALSPLGYMASKERDNVFTGLQTLFAQVFFVGLVGCWAVNAGPLAYGILVAAALFAFPFLALVFGFAELALSHRGDP